MSSSDSESSVQKVVGSAKRSKTAAVAAADAAHAVRAAGAAALLSDVEEVRLLWNVKPQLQAQTLSMLTAASKKGIVVTTLDESAELGEEALARLCRAVAESIRDASWSMVADPKELDFDAYRDVFRQQLESANGKKLVAEVVPRAAQGNAAHTMQLVENMLSRYRATTDPALPHEYFPSVFFNEHTTGNVYNALQDWVPTLSGTFAARATRASFGTAQHEARATARLLAMSLPSLQDVGSKVVVYAADNMTIGHNSVANQTHSMALNTVCVERFVFLDKLNRVATGIEQQHLMNAPTLMFAPNGGADGLGPTEATVKSFVITKSLPMVDFTSSAPTTSSLGKALLQSTFSHELNLHNVAQDYFKHLNPGGLAPADVRTGLGTARVRSGFIYSRGAWYKTIPVSARSGGPDGQPAHLADLHNALDTGRLANAAVVLGGDTPVARELRRSLQIVQHRKCWWLTSERRFGLYVVNARNIPDDELAVPTMLSNAPLVSLSAEAATPPTLSGVALGTSSTSDVALGASSSGRQVRAAAAGVFRATAAVRALDERDAGVGSRKQKDNELDSLLVNLSKEASNAISVTELSRILATAAGDLNADDQLLVDKCVLLLDLLHPDHWSGVPRAALAHLMRGVLVGAGARPTFAMSVSLHLAAVDNFLEKHPRFKPVKQGGQSTADDKDNDAAGVHSKVSPSALSDIAGEQLLRMLGVTPPKTVPLIRVLQEALRGAEIGLTEAVFMSPAFNCWTQVEDTAARSIVLVELWHFTQMLSRSCVSAVSGKQAARVDGPLWDLFVGVGLASRDADPRLLALNNGYDFTMTGTTMALDAYIQCRVELWEKHGACVEGVVQQTRNGALADVSANHLRLAAFMLFLECILFPLVTFLPALKVASADTVMDMLATMYALLHVLGHPHAAKQLAVCIADLLTVRQRAPHFFDAWVSRLSLLTTYFVESWNRDVRARLDPHSSGTPDMQRVTDRAPVVNAAECFIHARKVWLSAQSRGVTQGESAPVDVLPDPAVLDGRPGTKTYDLAVPMTAKYQENVVLMKVEMLNLAGKVAAGPVPRINEAPTFFSEEAFVSVKAIMERIVKHGAGKLGDDLGEMVSSALKDASELVFPSSISAACQYPADEMGEHYVRAQDGPYWTEKKCTAKDAAESSPVGWMYAMANGRSDFYPRGVGFRPETADEAQRAAEAAVAMMKRRPL